MRIENIHFKNIGVFDDELIEFQPTGKENQAEIHIITGPNGSGKSTILYGLASAFGESKEGHTPDTSNFFYKRFRYFGGVGKRNKENGEEKQSEPVSELLLKFDNDRVRVYGCKKCKSIHSETTNYQIMRHQAQVSAIAKPSEPLELGAFSYSGYRYIEGNKIDGVTELIGNPLANSLIFVKSNQSDDYNINQWIANNISKRSIAKEQGDKKAQKRYAQTVIDLENILSQILGQTLEFEIGLDPLNLYVKTNDALLDFDVLPDGMRSLISWIADLMMRLDELKWVDDTPIFERRLFLFLDEIEVHLHPKWQRSVLPIVQKLFKNAQIFVTTHSPFVVNSVDNAWIHPIRLEGGKATMEKAFKSESGFSYPYILREVFGIENKFSGPAKTELADFYQLRDKILRSVNETNYEQLIKKLERIGNRLRPRSTELNTIVEGEMRQLNTIIENERLNEKVG